MKVMKKEGSHEGHEGHEEEGSHEGHEGDEEEGSHEGHEGYEEEGCEGFAKGRHCRCTCIGNWSQEVGVFESLGCARGSWRERGEKGKVHDTRTGHAQDKA